MRTYNTITLPKFLYKSEYFKKECKSDMSNLVNDFMHFIKLRTLRSDFKQAFKEVREIEQGKVEGGELKDFIKELKSNV